jgi:hypothetical protein
MMEQVVRMWEEEVIIPTYEVFREESLSGQFW